MSLTDPGPDDESRTWAHAVAIGGVLVLPVTVVWTWFRWRRDPAGTRSKLLLNVAVVDTLLLALGLAVFLTGRDPGASRPPGHVVHVYLGVHSDRVDRDDGAGIARVDPDSAAEEAGLERGDRITHIDGEPIRDFEALLDAVGRHVSGQDIELAWVDGSGESDRATVSVGGRWVPDRDKVAAAHWTGVGFEVAALISMLIVVVVGLRSRLPGRRWLGWGLIAALAVQTGIEFVLPDADGPSTLMLVPRLAAGVVAAVAVRRSGANGTAESDPTTALLRGLAATPLLILRGAALVAMVALLLDVPMTLSGTYTPSFTDIADVSPMLVYVGAFLVAPVTEELMFRGLLTPLAAARWGHWTTIWVCGLGFAFIHGVQYQLATLAVVPIALLLTWLRLATGRLWPCMVLHAVYNALMWVLTS